MEVVSGSREEKIERLQKLWDGYVADLKAKVAAGDLTEKDAHGLADAYHKGLWEGVRAIYNGHQDRPRFEIREGQDFRDKFGYLLG